MCKALSFVDACAEKALSMAMSPQFPTGFRGRGAPILSARATELPGIKVLPRQNKPRATRRGRLIHSLNEVCL